MTSVGEFTDGWDHTEVGCRALPRPRRSAMSEIGKFRRARLIKKGYAVKSTNQDTGAVTWPLVDRTVHITAPLRVSRLYLADGTEFGFFADDQVFCRTPAEIERAAAREAREEVTSHG